MASDNRFKKLREEKIVDGKPMKKSDLRRELEKIGYKIDRNKMDRIEADLPNLGISAQPPDAEVLKAYSTYFNVTTDYLLGLRETAPIDENIAMINKTTGLSDKSIEYLKTASEEEKLILNSFIETMFLHRLTNLTQTYYEHLDEPLILGSNEIADENKKGYFDMILSNDMLSLFNELRDAREVTNTFMRKAKIKNYDQSKKVIQSMKYPEGDTNIVIQEITMKH